MANNIVPGNNGGVGKTNTAFSAIPVMSAANLTVLYEIGNPNKSWIPGRAINSVTKFTPNKAYYIIAKNAIDLEAHLVPPISGTVEPPDEEEPGGEYNATASAFFTRAESVGTLSTDEKDAYSQLVDSLLSAGLYNRFRVLKPYLGGSAAVAALNAISSSYTSSFIGSPIISTTGATFNGSTQYENIPFNLSEIMLVEKNNISVGIYIRSGLNEGWVFGAADASSGLQLNPRYENAAYGYNGSLEAPITVANTSAQGLYTLSRVSSNDSRLYKGAAQIGPTEATTNNAGLPAQNVYVGARNLNGAANSHFQGEVGLFFIAAGFNPSEMIVINNIFQTFLTSLGR
ncbi:MAG TPA: hypothetical protein VD794_05415 [Flavisolibacter sp.]|nr:hypothetical protein [Flavisolibacter sp.]